MTSVLPRAHRRGRLRGPVAVTASIEPSDADSLCTSTNPVTGSRNRDATGELSAASTTADVSCDASRSSGSPPARTRDRGVQEHRSGGRCGRSSRGFDAGETWCSSGQGGSAGVGDFELPRACGVVRRSWSDLTQILGRVRFCKCPFRSISRPPTAEPTALTPLVRRAARPCTQRLRRTRRFLRAAHVPSGKFGALPRHRLR